jgi:DNA-nicking Smr family endonuclease
MAKKKEPPSCSEADRRLFLQALGEVERVSANQEEPKPRKNAPRQDLEKSEFRDLLDDVNIDLHPEFIQKKISEPGRIKAQKRSDGPEAIIDLHACTLEVALKRTEEFLLRCHLKRFRKVLIIHGKGSGILRDGVRRVLEHHPLVAQTMPASKQHGGEGAIVVVLRR